MMDGDEVLHILGSFIHFFSLVTELGSLLVVIQASTGIFTCLFFDVCILRYQQLGLD
jgi:hypothetical protein